MKYKLAVFISNIFLALIKTIFKIPIIGDIISRNVAAKSLKIETFNYQNSFKFKSLKALVVNEKSFWRFKNLENKEPETHNFLSSINDNDTLWDIGANIGQMTLSAAKQSGCKIVSFEPDPANFFILSNNIFLNNLGDRVLALCTPLNDKNLIVGLPFDGDSVAFTNAGRSNVSIFEKSEKSELHNSVLSACITGDLFLNLYRELSPTHLKIDVHGIEIKILHGLQNVLSSKKLRSIIIEAVHSGAEANSDQITKIITSYGFKRNEAKENSIKTNKEIFNIVFERS